MMKDTLSYFNTLGTEIVEQLPSSLFEELNRKGKIYFHSKRATAYVAPWLAKH